MYTELAAIKDPDGICGFVVNDGTITMSIDMERAKRIAARGEMDTLAYEDGRFVPVIQGPLRRELMEEKALKRYEKACENMTFEDFIANDTIFKNEDVLWMRENENAVLASVSMAYDYDGKSRIFTGCVNHYYTFDDGSKTAGLKRIKKQQNVKDASKPNERFYGTYAQILTARDLCQYGHLDSFTLDRLLELNLQACPENQAVDRMLLLMGEIAKLGVVKADALIEKLKSAENAIEEKE